MRLDSVKKTPKKRLIESRRRLKREFALKNTQEKTWTKIIIIIFNKPLRQKLKMKVKKQKSPKNQPLVKLL